MRALALVFVLSMMLAAPVMAEEEPKWLIWAQDGADYPAPVPGDVDTIRVGATSMNLHVDFTTFATPIPALSATSELRFGVDQDARVSVRFSWGQEARLWIDDLEVLEGWAVSDASGPQGWQLLLSWDTIRVLPAGTFVLSDLEAATFASSAVPVMTDEASGPDIAFAPDSSGKPTASVVTLASGVTVEGPDYAGGTSVAIDDRGEPLIAYYIYDEDRGTDRGIYLARINADEATVPGFAAQRLDSTKVSRENGRDAQMRTQVAHDGENAFVLFTDDPAVDNDEDGPGHPGTPDSVYVLAYVDGQWQREDPTPNGVSDVGPEDVADLVARDGRVFAAVPVGDDVWLVQRDGPGEWRELTRLAGATNAKLAVDGQGDIHAAYTVYGSEDGNWREGTLYYAASTDGFTSTRLGEHISSGWEEPETDGSFAIAAGGGTVAVLWNDGRAERDEEQKVAFLESGEWSYDIAPLVPVHGNPQYTMRLAYTASGHLVAASGYGGTDTLAVREPNGGWTTKELDRYDVWDMAVSPAGTVYFAYTQPHGGTTVALTAFDISPDATDGPTRRANLNADAAPKAAPGVPVVASLALLVVAAIAQAGRRTR